MTIDPASPLPEAPEPPDAIPFFLLTARRFAPLIVTLCLGSYATLLFAQLNWPEASAKTLYALPLLLLAVPLGALAEHGDQARLIRRIKLLETLIITVAAFAVVRHTPLALAAALAVLGLLATLSAPLNYARLAQQLGDDERLGGTALLAAGYCLAALGATLSGTLLAATQLDGAPWTGFAVALLAAAALAASRRIVSAPAQRPLGARPPVAAPRHTTADAGQTSGVGLSIVASAWCWLCAAWLFAALTAAGPLATADVPAPLLRAALLVGGAVGALLCARVCGRRLDVGVVPFAALGSALFALLLPAANAAAEAQHGWLLVIDLAALGVFAALLSVALKVQMQSLSPPAWRARILSVSSLSNALAIVGGGLLAWFGPAMAWSVATIALGFAALAVHAYRRSTHRSLRFLTDLLIHGFYRVGKSGFEHIPQTGPAVLVCNHVSFVDSVVIMAAVRRPIRFVIDHRIYETPFANTIFRHSRTIPIATAKESLEQKEAAFAEVARALRNGELIGLFPEGKITRTGEINPFRYGVGRIVAETPVAVIPMALRGLWGSFYSRRYGPAMSRPSLLRLFAPIELVAGPAVPAAEVNPADLQERVGRLRGDWR